MSQVNVPNYKLYGENKPWSAPEPFHYESIAKRSILHNWEITAHRHDNLLQVLYLARGSAVLTLDTRVETLHAPLVMMIPPMVVHGFHFQPNVEGHVLTLPVHFVNQIFAAAPEAASLLEMPVLIPGKEVDTALFDSLFRRCEQEYRNHHSMRLPLLTATISLLLLLLAKYVERHPNRPAFDRGQRRYYRFNQLIGEHFHEHQPVSFYAGLLGISSTQLNNTCRREAGMSAQQLVHQRLLLEAKRLLVYTGMQITEIAYALGFSDPAYFTRFFKHRTACSPQQFRREQ
ncbi:MAG: helix-turn-helix domain-containing protein [Pseudomonadales bacterium]|nr:helix-turn-helix domain-containing protein [Pseudomonadales bacterium]